MMWVPQVTSCIWGSRTLKPTPPAAALQRPSTSVGSIQDHFWGQSLEAGYLVTPSVLLLWLPTHKLQI